MMRDDKLIHLFEFYTGAAGATKLPKAAFPFIVFPNLVSNPADPAVQHAAWMAREAISFVKDAQAFEQHHTTEHGGRSKREKAHRWLGFIQGVLWMSGVFTLDELKEHSHQCSDDYQEKV
jgi:hypothetical protein